MHLDEALTIAFERGAGVSRTHALRGRVPISGDFDDFKDRRMTTMSVLGERLADRAFRNLPARHRRAAASWATLSSQERMEALIEIYLDFTSDEWRKGGRSDPTTQPVVDRALPAQCGSWAKGPIMPNCLGLAQHLIGFARATGTRHLMVNTLTRQDELEWRRYLRNMQILQQALRRLPRSSDVVTKVVAFVQKEIKEKTSQIHRNVDLKQAHHCLLINIDDGDTWCFVDPYGGSIKQVIDDTPSGPTSTWHKFQAEPDVILVMSDPIDIVDEQALIRRMANVIRELVQARSKPGRLTADTLPSLSPLKPLYQEGVFPQDYAESEREVIDRLPEQPRLVIRQLLLQCLSEFDSLRASYKDGTALNVDATANCIDSVINRITAAFVELVRYASAPTLHPLMEVAHPAYFLGVATAHHVAVNSSEFCDTSVLAYSLSQFLLFDCLRYNEGTALDELAVRLSSESVTVLPSHFIMPELQFRIPKEWKTDHGSDE